MELEATLKLKGLEQDRLRDNFDALFYKHQGLVRSVIWQVAGDCQINDLVQEAFIKIWKGIDGFRGEAEITSWIYRVCVNVALDSKRGRNKLRALHAHDFDLTSIPDQATDSESDYSNKQIVDQGLKQLSDDHRTVVVLALIHELKISEIAEILEISEGTVKSRLHYGKESFRNYLSEIAKEEKL
jgi:RNA polymerase sigma-70 factor (ECF subfamily)